MVYQSDFIVRSCCVGETGDRCGARGRGWYFPSCCFVILQLGNLKLSYKPLLLPFRTLWEEPNRHPCLATDFLLQISGAVCKMWPGKSPCSAGGHAQDTPLRLTEAGPLGDRSGRWGWMQSAHPPVPSGQTPALPSPEVWYPASLPTRSHSNGGEPFILDGSSLT